MQQRTHHVGCVPSEHVRTHARSSSMHMRMRGWRRPRRHAPGMFLTLVLSGPLLCQQAGPVAGGHAPHFFVALY